MVKGPGATAFLDWFTCNKLPKVGRINLTYALTAFGTTRTEYTIVRNGENNYYLVSAGAWTEYDADFLRKAAEDKMDEFGYIEIQDVTTQWGVFAIAGPKSRDVLKEVIKDANPATALSNKRFPWLSARQIELGMCPVNAIRVAYTGELGYELHHPIEMQNYLFDLLEEAGKKHGMKLVGARAQNWLRQENLTVRLVQNWAAMPPRLRPTCRALSISTRTSTARTSWSKPAFASNAARC